MKANGSIGNTVSGRGGGGASCTSAWMRDTHEIVAVELTLDNVGDVTDLPDLLDQIDADIGSMTADGAYDGETVYDAVADRHPGAAVIIPPRAAAVQMKQRPHSATNILQR